MVSAMRILEDSIAHLRFSNGQFFPFKSLGVKGGSIVYFLSRLLFKLLVLVSPFFTSNFKFALSLRLRYFQFLF